jgi:hypothetical protein
MPAYQQGEGQMADVVYEDPGEFVARQTGVRPMPLLAGQVAEYASRRRRAQWFRSSDFNYVMLCVAVAGMTVVGALAAANAIGLIGG